MKAVQSFIALADFLYETKNLSHSQWSFIRQIWQTYLMELDFGKDDDSIEVDDDDDEDNDVGGYHTGRHLVTPKGYFRGAPPNLLAVSKALRIKYDGCIYLRHMLPYNLWSQLMKSHGLDPFSPLEVDFRCSGVEAIAGSRFETSLDCPNDPSTFGESKLVCLTNPSLSIPGRDFQTWKCEDCLRSLNRRLDSLERTTLSQRTNLTETESERLEKLERLAQNHRDRDKNRRKALGKEGATLQSRVKARRHQANQKRKFIEDPEAHEQYLAKKRKQNANRDRSKDAPRECDKLTTKRVWYPDWFHTKMEDATRRFMMRQNNPTVQWNDLMVLYRMMLQRECKYIANDRVVANRPLGTNGRVVDGTKVKEVVFCKNGKPKYYFHALRFSAENVLGQPMTGKTVQWTNPYFEDGKKDKVNTTETVAMMATKVLEELAEGIPKEE